MKASTYTVLMLCLAVVLLLPGRLSAGKSDLTKDPAKSPKSLKAAPSSKPENGPASESIHQKTGKPGIQPDLVITRLWLDRQCRLKIELRNTGKGRIPAQEFKRGQLAVSVNGKTVSFGLIRPSGKGPAVDPSGRLSRPGSRVVFNSNVTLSRRSRVRAYVDPGRAIAESNEANNRANKRFGHVVCAQEEEPGTVQSLSPGKTEKRAGSSQDPSNKPLARHLAHADIPRLEISRFTLHRGDPTELMDRGVAISRHNSPPRLMNRGVSAMSRGHGSGVESYTVDAGEAFTFRYRVTGTEGLDVTILIRKRSVDQAAAHSNIVRSREYDSTELDRSEAGFCLVDTMPDLNTHYHAEYVLEARAASPESGTVVTAERTLRVNVNKPQLVLERPEIEVSDSDIRVRFFVGNQGSCDSSGSFLYGQLRVSNWNRSTTFASHTTTGRFYDIPAGGRVEIASLSLTDDYTREQLYAASQILIEAELNDGHDFFVPDGNSISHTHHWSTQSETIPPVLIQSIFGLLSGELRLNNYQNPGSNTTNTRPGIRNDSWVEISLGSGSQGGFAGDSRTNRQEFTPPFLSIQMVGSLSETTYFDFRPFINDVSADFEGEGGISIPQRNVINLHLAFEAEGGREIKGYRFEDGQYVDDAAPDIDVRQLDLDLKFWLNLRGGRIVVEGISVRPTLNMHVTDRYSWILNKLRPRLEGYLKVELVRSLRDVADLDGLTAKMNNGIEEALGVLSIGYVNDFELTSEGLTLEYVPES